MVTPLSAVGITRYHRPAEAYTKIRNDFHRNPHIKLRAYRVAGYILSHIDGFTQTQKQIARACGLSITTVREALEDLREGGYLISRRLREHGRWIGTAYAVSDIPFSPEEVNALVGPCTDSKHSECEHTESVPPKKISSRSETTNPEEQDPSGGQTAGAAAPSLEAPSLGMEENPMPPSVASPGLDQFELFADIQPEPSKAKGAGKPKPPSGPSAGTVVAAFVDAYRVAHSGGDPVKSAIGRVARDAKMLIESGRAAATELERAAREMGGTPYNNLPVALDKLRQAPVQPRRQAGVAARPHTDPYWQEVQERTDAKWLNDLLTDDGAVRWVVETDPSEVDRLVAKWPELADRFRDVA